MFDECWNAGGHGRENMQDRIELQLGSLGFCQKAGGTTGGSGGFSPPTCLRVRNGGGPSASEHSQPVEIRLAECESAPLAASAAGGRLSAAGTGEVPCVLAVSAFPLGAVCRGHLAGVQDRWMAASCAWRTGGDLQSTAANSLWRCVAVGERDQRSGLAGGSSCVCQDRTEGLAEGLIR